MYFACDHGRSLTILGPDRQYLATLRSETLQRVIPPPMPEFEIDPARTTGTIHGRVGDTFNLALPVASLAAYRSTWTMKPSASKAIKLYVVTGQGNQGVYTAVFMLKAAMPGTAKLEFTSTEHQGHPLSFAFEIEP